MIQEQCMCGSSTIQVCLIGMIFKMNYYSFIFTAEFRDLSEKPQEVLAIIIVPTIVFLVILVPVLIIAIRTSIKKCKNKGMDLIFPTI